MARSLRQLSTHCGKCGVQFDETLSNKQPKRAMCVECYLEEGVTNRIKKAKYDKENRKTPHRQELYHDYKVQNRQNFWRAINKEIRTLTKRDEIRAFISKQMDRILSDETLMDYINHTTMVENNKK